MSAPRVYYPGPHLPLQILSSISEEVRAKYKNVVKNCNLFLFDDSDVRNHGNNKSTDFEADTLFCYGDLLYVLNC